MARFLKRKVGEIALLVLISAAIYLPLVREIGCTHDDWYLMYAAQVKGVSIFHTIFSVDRPLRAFVMIPAYQLFGENPLYYNLSAYFFRLLSGVGFLWMSRLLWKKQRRETLSMTLIFILYPGFLSLPNGIDYQSQMVAIAAATFSLGLTVKALLTSSLKERLIYFSASALLAWLYLGLVEYFMGIEILRFLFLFLIIFRRKESWRLKIKHGISEGFYLLLVSLPFFYWRFFIFKSERGATDIDKQLIVFLTNPLRQLFIWGQSLLQDSLRVLIGAWTIDFEKFFFLEWVRYAASFILIAGLLYQLYFYLSAKKKNNGFQENDWRREALFIGVLALLACQFPIVAVNRQVSFPVFSRYALAGSLGAAMVLVALIDTMRLKFFKESFFVTLLLIAGLTHYANTQKFAAETASMNDFWWQVSWRVPHLSERTTLMVNYPLVSTEEDYFIWGPANQIYYPEGTSEDKVIPGIYAYILNDKNIEKVIARDRQEYDLRRGIETYPNARNILILSQPTTNSCVHIIDGLLPEYSPFESEKVVMRIGAFSEVEHIDTHADFHAPPEAVFGPEPAHAWCYFYQKATLARQTENWGLVADLLAEASAQGFAPQDPVEWLPFIQATAKLGDGERVQEIASHIQNDFVMQQACSSLSAMELTPEIHAVANDSYCISK